MTPKTQTTALTAETIARADRITGLQYEIPGDFIEKWREMAKTAPPEAHQVDVRFIYGDKQAEFTFEDFLARLGLL